VSDQLFIVLRVCLLALVYLVFLRVLRAVWVELRAEGAEPALIGARPAPAQRAARPAPVATPAPVAPTPVAATSSGTIPARLVVAAPAALAGQTFLVEGETTIGRGAGCAVAIDDAHVSKLHARVYPQDGGWLVEDLGSTNGTSLNGTLITAPVPIMVGGQISIGEIVLELT
jgi:pSer/pThr/pTyr-binding forkhead associated (FHA) protein